MLTLRTLVATVVAVALFAPIANGQEKKEETASYVLIQNVRIFDGENNKLTPGHVLIENNLIKAVGAIDKVPQGTVVIDGKGGTLTPGLIDMHQHLMLGGKAGLFSTGEDIDFATAGAIAAQAMYAHLLMKGVTSVRDIAGNSLGLAKGVKEGTLTGPRIYSCGPAIQPTGGHTDIGGWNENKGEDESVLMTNFAEVNGPLEVIKQSRWNFRKGAAFTKIMVGGGVASDYDPLEVVSLTMAEVKAAVAIAEDQKTYVSVHAYNDDAVIRALDGGVKCVEHAFLVSEDTIKRMARDNIILSLQGYVAGIQFANPEVIPWYTAEQVRKAKQVHVGTLQMVEWARKHKVFIISGSDMFAENWPITKKNITIEVELFKFTPYEALLHATGNAGKVLAMSGPARSPYREGPLGVVKEGAYADVLIWHGNPLENIKIIEDESNLKLIVKDGMIYKNTTVPATDKQYRPAPEYGITPPKVTKGGNAL